jgi:uncharacterized membrane protein
MIQFHVPVFILPCFESSLLRKVYCKLTQSFTHSLNMVASTLLPCLLVFIAIVVVSVSSFSVVVPLAKTTVSRSIHHPFTTLSRKPVLLRESTAEDPNMTTLADKIIKELEKEEAKMVREGQRALEKLNQCEMSLSKLQIKKQEYLNGGSLTKNSADGNFSETALRSAVKAFLWRVIAGVVTFITSLQFSGSITTALSIVGSDFFSKAFTMFIGERIMNKSQAGRKSGSDDARRSLVKALIWRLFAICNTMTMAIFIAKDLNIASKIAGSDAIFKTALMFAYERAWARIEWGKEYQVEYNLSPIKLLSFVGRPDQRKLHLVSSLVSQ